MLKLYPFTSFLLLAMVVSLSSCKEKYAEDDFQAYFGGEVTNPTNRYVLFGKDNEVFDTIPLNADNTFFKSFASLKPGLYTFRHDPEYQYVYFDKNDSLMVRINSRDFDESIVFCGKGDEKNNFMMELYLRNERDKNKLFPFFDKDIATFTKHADSTYKDNKKYYKKNKDRIDWSPGFDFFANAMIDYNYFGKKEIYPQIHRVRTGNTQEIPKDFYAFRKDIDFNDATLSNFSPFITYMSHMLNNMASEPNGDSFDEVDLALRNTINKIRIADTLIKNDKIKNALLNSIAFNYLLEDQNIVNNRKFLDAYLQHSTDKTKKNEIIEIGKAISMLKPGNHLPKVNFQKADGSIVSSDQLTKGNKTVFYFWTENLNTHFVEANKKAIQLKTNHPEYNFVAINVDGDAKKWKSLLKDYKFDGITQLHSTNFEELRKKWAIIKIHRTIIVDSDGTIRNAFTNLFNADFSHQLQRNKLVTTY